MNFQNVVIPDLGDLANLVNLHELSLRDIGERIESIVSKSEQEPKETVDKVYKRTQSAEILASLVLKFNEKQTKTALLSVLNFVNSPDFVEPYCNVSTDYFVTREQHNITIRYIKKHFSTDPTLILNFSKTSSIMKEEQKHNYKKKIDALKLQLNTSTLL